MLLRRRAGRITRRADGCDEGYRAVYERLAEELPDEDLPEVPSDLIDFYVWGSRPRCEEQEFADTVRAAVDHLDG